MSAYEIHIDSNSPTCRVISGVGRRTFLSTPRAVGVALIQMDEAAAPAASAAVGDMRWQDLLPSHGVAVGVRGRQTITLALIPPKQRTVRCNGTDVTATYPTTLLAMLQEGEIFTRGGVYIADASRQAQMGVLSTVPLLISFPYGNVYEGGRICWGSTSPRAITSIRDFEEIFFGSGFNQDLWNANAGGGSVAEIAAANGGVLPPPARFGRTISQAIAQVLAATT